MMLRSFSNVVYVIFYFFLGLVILYLDLVEIQINTTVNIFTCVIVFNFSLQSCYTQMNGMERNDYLNHSTCTSNASLLQTF